MKDREEKGEREKKMEEDEDLLPLNTCPGGGIKWVVHTPHLLPKYTTPHQSKTLCIHYMYI